MLRIAALALALIILVGCGTKGPLYLPEPTQKPGADRNPSDSTPRR
jgi:predicted small lipoprotein YifL